MIIEIEARGFASAAIPFEDQAPSFVDANRVQPVELTAQLLEMVARRHPQVLIARRVIDHLKLAKQPAFEIGRDIPGLNVVHE
jgi:hypothetical protein